MIIQSMNIIYSVDCSAVGSENRGGSTDDREMVIEIALYQALVDSITPEQDGVIRALLGLC